MLLVLIFFYYYYYFLSQWLADYCFVPIASKRLLGQKGDKMGRRKEEKLGEECESPPQVKQMTEIGMLQIFSFQKAVFQTLPASSQS